MSNFEENVMEMLEEMNQRQKDFRLEVNNRFDSVNKRFDKIESDLQGLKETTNMIYNEVGSSREDITILEEDVEVVQKEQVYQLSKWVDLDRRVSKLERKTMS